MSTTAKLRIALIAVVCAAVFYTSFRHIVDVAEQYGNSADVALLYPVCIDAVILISAFTLIARREVSKMARWYAKLGRLFGFSATIFCNVASSEFASSVAVAVALIPALSLILTVELLVHASAGTASSRRVKASVRPLRAVS